MHYYVRVRYAAHYQIALVIKVETAGYTFYSRASKEIGKLVPPLIQSFLGAHKLAIRDWLAI